MSRPNAGRVRATTARPDWPGPVRDIYARAEREIDDLAGPGEGQFALHYGPGHVAWADGNLDCAAWCAGQCDAPQFADTDPAVLAVVRRSLEELAALPPHVRDA